ncbi:MAG: hypothetical protein M1828_006724 [Chrysothrix sp. TS-e1954]|nr:MAG: hypothetical protein M1828_006724 [Chrysothrix sp. TS-e1954]
MHDDSADLLRPPSDKDEEQQATGRTASSYQVLHDFELAKAEGYQQQYGDMYFLRLARLKPAIEKLAIDEWEGKEIAGDVVHKVERVLDVRQGELCWVTGTVYWDMPLKPNILDDISKDHWIAAPPPREKYVSPEGHDKVMLEDDSGRLRLIGERLGLEILVTGCIIAVMGTENANGDFEVIDIKLPDLPTQPERWQLENKKQTERPAGGKVALVSGLEISGDAGDTLALDMLLEWLLGESTGSPIPMDSSQISRLIIAGNSLAASTPLPAREDLHPAAGKKGAASKKYGYDSSAYNPAPTAQFDAFLFTLLPSIPVTLLPGPSDPANVSMPQQPLHPALFPQSRAYAPPPNPDLTSPSQNPKKKKAPTSHTFPLHPATNPIFSTLSGHLALVTGGQATSDIAKYVPSSMYSSPLDLIEHTLRWRLIAPTAPDTLWSYPFRDHEPFVLEEGRCPHLYVVGNQERFGTRIVEGVAGQRVRIVSLPSFRQTGELALVDLEDEDLGVEMIKFSTWQGG